MKKPTFHDLREHADLTTLQLALKAEVDVRDTNLLDTSGVGIRVRAEQVLAILNQELGTSYELDEIETTHLYGPGQP